MRDLPRDLLALVVDGAWDRVAPDGGATEGPLTFAGFGVRLDVVRGVAVDVAPLVAEALALEAAGDGVERSNVGGFHSHADAFDACAAAGAAKATIAAAAAARAPPARPRRKRRRHAVADVVGARVVADGDWRLRVDEDGAGGLVLAGAARPGDVGAADGDGAEAWYNVSRAGHFHALHDHAGAATSGVLWLDTPPPPPPPTDHSGAFFVALRAPRGGDRGAYALLEATPKTMVLFDGDLPHAVLPLAPDALRHPRDARVSLSFNFPDS